MQFILEVFQYEFMIRALAAGCLIAVVAPVIGVFMVVRRYSLITDTLAHVSLLGVAIGVLTGIDPVITTLIASFITALLMEKLQNSQKLMNESILPVFLFGSLSLAIVLISLKRGVNVNLTSFLFGSITTVTLNDIYLMIFLSIPILIIIKTLYPKLFLISLNEDLAKTSGINVRFINGLLIVLAAITISLSIRIVGALLIGALMVIPVLTAMQLSTNFKQTIQLSILASLVSVISGLLCSYYFDTSSGATIVIIALIMFGFSLVSNSKRN